MLVVRGRLRIPAGPRVSAEDLVCVSQKRATNMQQTAVTIGRIIPYPDSTGARGRTNKKLGIKFSGGDGHELAHVRGNPLSL